MSDAPSPATAEAASVASGDAGSFVIASVRAPRRLATAITTTTSGDWPDWLMPMTSARPIRGGRPYRLNSDGVASPTGSRATDPSAYWAYTAAWSELPRAAIRT